MATTRTPNFITSTQQRIAFTLAEVLIVVGIIGMIAEMTIPVVMQNVEKQRYVGNLKKTVTTMQQGYMLMMSNQGINDFQDTDLMKCTEVINSTDLAASTCVEGEMKKVFKIINSSVATGSNIFPSGYKWLTRWNDGQMDVFRLPSTKTYSFTTIDGINIGIRTIYPCQATSTAEKVCTRMYIDVNGPKKPNQWGKDAFMLYATNTGKVGAYRDKNDPDGYWRNLPNQCGVAGQPASSQNDIYGNCASRIIENGWTIDYY